MLSSEEVSKQIGHRSNAFFPNRKRQVGVPDDPGNRTVEIFYLDSPKGLAEVQRRKSLPEELWISEQPHVVAADEIGRITHLRMPIPGVELCGRRGPISIE